MTKEILSNNNLLQNNNPLWQKIDSELSELVDYISEKDHPIAPYVNSLLEKYNALANDNGKCCDNNETTLSHFLSQIYKASPYVKTNAPLPRNLRFPIVS